MSVNNRLTRKANRKQRQALATMAEIPARAAAHQEAAPPAPAAESLSFTVSGISQAEYNLISAAWRGLQRANGRLPVEEYLEDLLTEYAVNGTIRPGWAREAAARFSEDFETTRRTVIDFLAQNPYLANIGDDDEEAA